MLQAVTYYAREPAPHFTPPAADKTKWLPVLFQLTSKLNLPGDLVKELNQQGLVYADDKQNAVVNLPGATVDVRFNRSFR